MVDRPEPPSGETLRALNEASSEVAEERAARAQALLGAVANAAHDLLVADSWQSAIASVLERVGEAAGVSRAHVLLTRELLDEEEGEVVRHFEWTAQGVSSASTLLLGATAASLGGEAARSALRETGVFKTTRADAGGMRGYLEATGTLAALAVPVLDQDVPHAVLVLEDCERERAWEDGELDAARNLAAILGARMRRQSVESALRFQEDRHRRLLETIPCGITYVDREGRHRYANRALGTLLGLEPAEIVGTRIWDRSAGEAERERTRAGFLREIAGAAPAGSHVTRERRADGSFVDLQIDWALDFGPDGEVAGVASVLTDITERLAQRAALERSLAEKSVLLREVHHRVKNNLQIVASLLRLNEGSSSGDPLHAAEHRIGSIALVHDVLTRSEDLAHVDLSTYVEALVENLRDCVGIPGRDITLEHACDPIELALDAAVPVGLVLNEAISNALEHAFPHGSGSVRVEGRRADGGEVALTVRDDGCGLPASVDPAHPRTLGLQLIRELCQQVGGRVAIRSAPGEGVRVHLTLPASATQ